MCVHATRVQVPVRLEEATECSRPAVAGGYELSNM